MQFSYMLEGLTCVLAVIPEPENYTKEKAKERAERAATIGPTCYNCQSISDPMQCSSTKQCAIDEYCYAEVNSAGAPGQTTYNLGCKKVLTCAALSGGTIPVVGKRHENARSIDSNRKRQTMAECNRCCSSNNCNNKLCHMDSPNAPNPTVPGSSSTYVRLVGGSNPYEGRAEVFHSNVWGTICDDYWTPEDAAVVCGMLGYSREGSVSVPNHGFGSAPSFAHIWMDNVTCSGFENNIDQCQFAGWGIHDCRHGEDSGIECSSASSEDNIIFVLDINRGGAIYRMNLHTLSYVQIPINTLYTPTAMDYEATEGRIYFVDPRLLQIVSVHFSGTDIRELKQLDSNSDLEKIEVDPLNRILFYADTGNNQIASLRLDGTNFKIVINSGLDEPRDVVLDPRSQQVFWSDWGSTPKIEKAGYDGTGRTTIASTNLKWPNGMAIDFDANKLYFVDAGTDKIEVMGLNGENRQTIYTETGSHFFALSLYQQYIYYTDWTKHTVMRINKDGTGATPVGPRGFRELADIRVHKYGYGLPGVATHAPLVIDESHMFVRFVGTGQHNEGLVEVYVNGVWGTICDDGWTNTDAGVICSMMGFSSQNAIAFGNATYGSDNDVPIYLDEVNCKGTETHIAQCQLPQGWALHDCDHNEDAGVKCQYDPNALNNFILSADGYMQEIYRMDMETGSYSAIPNQNIFNPVAIDFDTKTRKVFYSDVKLSQLRSTNLDGTGMKVLKQLSYAATPDGIAVDSTRQRLYYTDYGNELVAYLDLGSLTLTNVTTTDVHNPRGITLDTQNQVIYWTDWGSSPKIEKVNYDGTGRMVLANDTLKYPNGIVLDTSTGKLIFCDAGTNKIESMNTDGSQRKVVFEDAGAHFYGIDVDGTYIYFSDWNKDGVMKINKDGTHELPIGPPVFGKVNAITVVTIYPAVIPTVPGNHQTYVRLVGGANPYMGRVEVFHNGYWGSICDDDWTGINAGVVCGMLGYSREGSVGVSGAAFGSAPATAHIWMDNVNCTGYENNIDECHFNGWGVHDCSHGEDSAVECSSASQEDNMIFLLDINGDGLIYRMDLYTQSYVRIPINRLYTPTAIDYNPIEGRIYFVDGRLKQLASMHFTGDDIRELKQLDTNADLDKIEVDPINRRLFYADTGNNQIGSLSLDGSDFRIIVNSGLDEPRDVVSDPRNRIVYWSDWGSSPKIEKANYDGTGRTVVVNSNLKWPNGMAIDFDENKLYFVDAGTDKIESTDLNGGSRHTIYTETGSHFFAISIFQQYLYYTDWTEHSVMRINKDGTGRTHVGAATFRELADIRVHKYGYGLPGVVTPSPIVIDESHMFVRLVGTGGHNEGTVQVFVNGVWGSICDDHWGDVDAGVICHMLGFGREHAVAVSDARYGTSQVTPIFLDEVACSGAETHIAQCQLPQGWAIHDCGHGEDAGVKCQYNPSQIRTSIITTDSRRAEIYRIDMETGSYSAIPNQNVFNPVAIGFDSSQKTIYYSDVRLHQIRSTNIDGSGMSIVKQLAGVADGLSIDETHRLLFYTDYARELVAVMNLDGSSERNVTTTGISNPRGITLDTANRIIYWTDWGSSPKIERSGYDGTGRQTIVTTDLSLPNAIVLDTNTGKLIFADAGTNKIESVNTDGSGRQVIFEDAGAHFFGLDVDQTYIYFSDWNKEGILRINKDGTHEVNIGPPSFGRMNGIKIING
ncbi:low-density lipoprotein receptor-related protein 4-like [Mytilus californianus]|uniref:low-density lipoprotein receptor-related protein 4-like n=1 Tax=Mytilus californianus TaxID=6549 RepID=UPI002245924E|nr:low-density lipoprotein receptor-related protein 4-like [Mytilus californianus]